MNSNAEGKPLILNTTTWKVIRDIDVQIHACLTPVFEGFTLAFALKLRRKHRKHSVRVAVCVSVWIGWWVEFYVGVSYAVLRVCDSKVVSV